MSYDSHQSSSSVRRAFDRFGYPHLLGVTVALVAATILLGVATRASGAGLACDANWPLCDGGVLNLFPATFPSFFEWIHRVVAGVAGFFIVGSALAAWRGGTRSTAVQLAVTAGMVLTPIQVYLGRETVLSYDLPVLLLHFWTAIVIFVCFVAAAAVVWADKLSERAVTYSLVAAVVLVPLHVLFSPVVVDGYSQVLETFRYALTLGVIVAVTVPAVVGRRQYAGTAPTVLLSLVLPILGAGVITLGRESLPNPALELPYLLVGIALAVAALASVLILRRSRPVRA